MPRSKQPRYDDKVHADPPAELATSGGGAKLRPCPICGKPAIHAVRPFCSKRCADIDLHRWLGGSYAIPVVEGGGPDRDESDEDA